MGARSLRSRLERISQHYENGPGLRDFAELARMVSEGAEVAMAAIAMAGEPEPCEPFAGLLDIIAAAEGSPEAPRSE